jgi:hypothetical protein
MSSKHGYKWKRAKGKQATKALPMHLSESVGQHGRVASDACIEKKL